MKMMMKVMTIIMRGGYQALGASPCIMRVSVTSAGDTSTHIGEEI